MDKERLQYLLATFRSQLLTEKEQQELLVICQSQEEEIILEELSAIMLSNSAATEPLPQLDVNAFIGEIVAFDKTTNTIFPAMQTVPEAVPPATPVQPLYKKWWAAASVGLLVCLGAYLWINDQNKREQLSTIPSPSDGKNIPAGRNGAVLTLADGSTVVLDSLGNGLVANEQGTNVILKDKQLQYEVGSKLATEIAYNTMTTPRGRQYQLVLPDGTKVWLNAASSLRYPTRFAGKERRVEIDGEAYFEVAKNRQQPFIVQTASDRIMVTGTQFNVNAYADEPFVKTSLVEGSVLINNKLLKPGQAYFNGTILNTNTDQDIAWKNGYFNFNNLDLPTMMRQLERWYNIETKFEGNVQQISFKGKMDRGLDLSDILFFFTESKIRYKLEGRILTVYGN